MGVVVKLSGGRDPKASLAPLAALVEEDMAHVNRIILDRARSNVELIPELARHLIEFRRQAASPDAHHRGGQALLL